jgi:TonB family protein
MDQGIHKICATSVVDGGAYDAIIYSIQWIARVRPCGGMKMSRILISAIVLLFCCGPISLYCQVRLDSNAAEGLLLERPVPVPSELAQRARIAGSVKILITVSDTGSVTRVAVIDGHPLLNDCAIASVNQSKYKPYSPEGKAVPFTTVVEIPVSPLISQKDFDRDLKLAGQYFEQEAKCRDLINASKWPQAEETCVANLAMADKLRDYRVRTKMFAYRLAGSAMLGQDKYKEALKYLNRALGIGKPSLGEDDADLGDLYVMMGNTQTRTGDSGAAKKSYAKGVNALQLAHDNTRDPVLRPGYLQRLKKALEYNIRAAEATGATKEAETLKQRLASLQ